jgi:hypothetical protein
MIEVRRISEGGPLEFEGSFVKERARLVTTSRYPVKCASG